MKFMMLMIPAVYRNNRKLPDTFGPDPEMVKKMTKFNEEFGKAVRIMDLNGLQPLSRGARVTFAEGKATVTDGASVEAEEVLGGYWMVEAESKKEVLNWARKCPAQDGDIIEIRPVFDFGEK